MPVENCDVNYRKRSRDDLNELRQKDKVSSANAPIDLTVKNNEFVFDDSPLLRKRAIHHSTNEIERHKKQTLKLLMQAGKLATTKTAVTTADNHKCLICPPTRIAGTATQFKCQICCEKICKDCQRQCDECQDICCHRCVDLKFHDQGQEQLICSRCAQ